MSRIWFFGLMFSLLLNLTVKAQYVSEILEYQPAPGQLINTTAFGSPQAAQSIIGNSNGLVSLGAYGGYIVVKMEEPIENDPQNPFGVDFTIFGNAMPGWSEAAAVQVMKDENNNGMADDEWYILAGSDYFFSSTLPEFQIDYFKPEQELGDVLWVDENQDSGFVFVNSIHQHSYYPNEDYFPNINQSNQSYSGIKIQGLLDFSNPAYVRSFERGFGYADNQPRRNQPFDIPDNPYTSELENSGGDAFDISWARGENGERVYLNQIDFIKISTAMNHHAGHLGEISSEISGIIDISPNLSISGITNCIVIEDIPNRLLINSNTPLNGFYFENGIPNESAQLIWNSSSENTAIIQNNILFANDTGLVNITATSLQNPEISNSLEIHIVEPTSIEMIGLNPFLQLEDELEINSIVKDNEGFVISGLQMEFEISDPQIIQLDQSNQLIKITALEEGSSWLKVGLLDFPNVRDSVLIHVSDQSQLIKVFVNIKTQNQTILARQSLAVLPSAIEDFIDSGNSTYHANEINPNNLAQAIISAFKKMGLEDEFRFKSDEGNNQLYLWKVPIENASSLEYVYGYGGKTDAPYERCWIVKINEENVVRDFQEIPVQNMDDITIYHISDITQSWNLKEFKSTNDSVEQKGDIQVTLEEFEMQMYANAQVYTLNQWSLANKSIYLDGEVLWFNETPVITNSNGQAGFQLIQEGDHTIMADGEEIKIHVNQATGIEELANSQIQIYPNPVSGAYLNISNSEENTQGISIFNLAGQLIWSTASASQQIPIKILTPGTYILQIRTEKQVFHQRFIKP